MSCPSCGHAAGLGLELGSLPGQQREAHVSLSKGSHGQSSSSSQHRGLSFVSEPALTEVSSPGRQLGSSLVQGGREGKGP